jgi:predicted RNase H-like HicB family nuclease
LLSRELSAVTIRYFPAVLERAAHGVGVYFPDLPGCVAQGNDAADAAARAEAALHQHLLGMIRDDATFPEPTTLESLERDAGLDAFAVILVRAELPGHAVRIDICLDEILLSRIDRAAAQQGISRSAFLAEAARQALAGAARAG